MVPQGSFRPQAGGRWPGTSRKLHLMSGERPHVLDRRTLNRTLLRRQFLLGRQRMRPAEAIRHLVALQAQEPVDPYVGLWTRLDGFDPLALSTSLERRRTVRMTLLRGTLHLVTADDAIALRSVLQPAIEATFSGSGPLRSASDAVPRDLLLAFIRSCLDERARS